ncbi:hypothetical protein K7B10_38595 [Streptomyces flavotricini]|uniref:Chitinase n=1 Tax=Streptomyces flavotricini TaxID=66888 RepID=A0ABS8EHM1_9ACTN|nr:hypothetical protein [Streptomyces flavotricini]MCC0100578.1 hypothetical protein [Streptomyces flavotricini]
MKAPKRDKSSRCRTTVAASLALAGTLLAVPYIAQAATADEPVSGPVQAPPSELGWPNIGGSWTAWQVAPNGG